MTVPGTHALPTSTKIQSTKKLSEQLEELRIENPKTLTTYCGTLKQTLCAIICVSIGSLASFSLSPIEGNCQSNSSAQS